MRPYINILYFVVSDRFRYEDFNDGERDVVFNHRQRLEFQVNLRYALRSNIDLFAVSGEELRRLFRLPQHLVLDLARILSPFVSEGVS